MKRMNAIVRGRVQGVGFRDATASTARALGLRGWVRNRPDGSVEVLAEGEGEALERLQAFLRTGPRFAEVTDLELSWPGSEHDQKSDLQAFAIRS